MVKLTFKEKIQDLHNRGTSTMLKYLLKRGAYEFRKKLLKQRFVEINVHNYRMIVDLNDPGISRTLIHFGTREKDHIYILNKELSSGLIIIGTTTISPFGTNSIIFNPPYAAEA